VRHDEEHISQHHTIRTTRVGRPPESHYASMEPWRAEGQWETVKPLKGGKAVAKDDSQGQAKKGKKGGGIVIQPEFRERTGKIPQTLWP